MQDDARKEPDRLEDLPPAEPYLRLARRGKDLWNGWAKGSSLAHKPGLTALPPPDRVVDFSGVDFTLPENDGIDFSGYLFKAGVSFSGARFRDGTTFQNCDFRGAVDFSQAKFCGDADFSGLGFLEFADFTAAIFQGRAVFGRGRFHKGATFDDCRFGGEADFSAREFARKASFLGAKFEGQARFDGAVMGEVAVFDQATFADLASFRGDESHCQNLRDIFFAESRFEGLADFGGREFKGPVSFRGTRFAEPPEFAGTKGHERIDPVEIRVGIAGHGPGLLPWKKARDWVERFKPRWWAVRLAGDSRVEGWTVDSDKLVRIRRLRKIMADIHAGDQERDLFVLERKAERGVLVQRWRDWKRNGKEGQAPPWPYGSITLLWLFDLLSDCGRSAKRPLGWFGAKLLAFWGLYLCLVDRPTGMPTGQFREDVASFALGHALPFVGSLNPARDAALRRLFEDGAKLDVPFGIELISSGQSILGALLLFLVLQAVRNHFRLK